MKNLLFLLLPAVALLFHSCVKEEPTNGQTTAEGYARDIVNGKAVPGAAVFLTRYRTGQATAMGKQQVQSLYADEKGKFSFSFDAEKDYQYEVCAEAEHYDKTFCVSVYEGKKNQEMVVKLSPYSYIRFHLLNEQPLDYVYFNYEYELDLYINRDTIVYGRTYSGNHTFHILLTKGNGIRTVIRDTLNFTPLDTIDYTIKY